MLVFGFWKGFRRPLSVNCFSNPIWPIMRHSENGADSSRVKGVLTRAVCHCPRASCFNRFKPLENEIMQFLEMFWGLEKPAQDAFDQTLVGYTDWTRLQIMSEKGLLMQSKYVLFPVSYLESHPHARDWDCFGDGWDAEGQSNLAFSRPTCVEALPC